MTKLIDERHASSGKTFSFHSRGKRFLSMIILLGMLLVSVLATYFYSLQDKKRYQPPLAPPIVFDPNTATQNLQEDFTLKAEFSSHLPLIIIQMDQNVLYSTEKKQVKERFQANIHIIHNDSAQNRLRDKARWESPIQISRRGNSSLHFEKGQYSIFLTDEKDQSREMNLFSMGNDDSWILSGSMVDKSLMRNYLAYTLANDIMEYAPKTQYCEVVFQNGDNYYYEGVYLFVQRIGKGKERVNINQANVKDKYTDFIIRRDRSGKEDITLNTYGTREGLTYKEGEADNYGHLGVVYPPPRLLNEDSTMYIQESIDVLEKALYSENNIRFFQYKNYIDVPSFIDYALINELLYNYDAGYHSTYFYRPKGGKIHAGPVWDFDQAMNNYRYSPSDPDGFYFFQAPWFDRLIRDYEFVQKMEKRYQELRQSVFSDKHIERIIDEVSASLGNAQVRDWMRWEHQYIKKTEYILHDVEESDGDIMHRNTQAYSTEISHLKQSIRNHAHSLDVNLYKLERDCIDATEKKQPWKILFAIFSILAFFISIILVRRMS